VYFNNKEDHLSAATSTTMMLVGLRSDCGVFFAQSQNAGTTCIIRAVQKQIAAGNFKKGVPTQVAVGTDLGLGGWTYPKIIASSRHKVGNL
jgi:hypothetical protein